MKRKRSRSSGKLHHKGAGHRKPRRAKSNSRRRPKQSALSHEEICEQLNHWQETMWKRLRGYALWRATSNNLPDAETVALEALTRAVFGFRCRARSEAVRHQALFYWVRSKIDYALRNLAAAYPVRAVRDGFIEFEKRYGYEPNWIQLAKFLGLNPRHVHNVWTQVRLELHRKPRSDRTSDSMEEEGQPIHSWEALDNAHNATDAGRPDWVQQALAQMRPADACLLILRDSCGYDEQEVLSFLDQMRQDHASSASLAYLEFQLSEFVSARACNYYAPWDFALLDVFHRGTLALRILRARRRFVAVLAVSGNFLARMQPVSATLVILHAVCQYSEPQILSFLARARRARALGARLDDLEDLLDAFVGAKAPGLCAPWDNALLRIRTADALRRQVLVAKQELLALAMSPDRS